MTSGRRRAARRAATRAAMPESPVTLHLGAKDKLAVRALMTKFQATSPADLFHKLLRSMTMAAAMEELERAEQAGQLVQGDDVAADPGGAAVTGGDHPAGDVDAD